MNMFRARSPFNPPHISGSIGRNKPSRSMSIQQPQTKQIQVVSFQKDQLQLATGSSYDQKFCFSLGVPVQGDPSIYWTYQLTSQVSSQSTRRLIFRQQQYFTKGLTQNDIYQTIYIVADGVQGYRNKNGIQTNRVCALHLCQIHSVIDDADVKTYDLLYRQSQDLAWQIPMNLGQLMFKIECQTAQLVQTKSGQLAVPIVCQFDIRHVGK